MNDREFRRHVRRLGFAWLALIALMLASFGSAYIPLGIANPLIGTGIAVVKASIVIALFMGLLRADALIRIVAAVALGTWCLLMGLGGLDEVTRSRSPAVFEQPLHGTIQPEAR